MGKGLFITLEGIDRSGKGTQIQLLKEWAETRKENIIFTREPGGTTLGIILRAVVQDSNFLERVVPIYKELNPEINIELDATEKLSPEAELMYYSADGAHTYRTIVHPNREAGNIVIQDRGRDSTRAYQAHALIRTPLAAEAGRINMLLAYQEQPPDRTYLIDITINEMYRRQQVEEAEKRTKKEFGEAEDRIEARKRAFHDKVYEGYHLLAKQEPERWKVIDGTMTQEEIHETIIIDLENMITNL